jgi:FkbM family methyltransferase
MAYPKNSLQKLLTLIRTVQNWYLVLPDKIGLMTQPISYKTRSGMVVTCRPKSPDINETTIIFSDFEYPSKYLHLEAGDTVLDLGGNIGLFALYINQINKNTSFNGYVFEPFVGNTESMKINFENNDIRNFTIIEKAVSDTDEFLYIDTTLSPDAISANKEQKGEKIPSVKLSTFAKEKKVNRISLLKMDIEGGEYPIFENDYEFVRNNVDRIIMEYHTISDNQNVETIKTILSPDFFIEIVYEMGHGGVLYAKRK